MFLFSSINCKTLKSYVNVRRKKGAPKFPLSPVLKQLIVNFKNGDGSSTNANGSFGSQVWMMKLWDYLHQADINITYTDVCLWIAFHPWILVKDEKK